MIAGFFEYLNCIKIFSHSRAKIERLSAGSCSIQNTCSLEFHFIKELIINYKICKNNSIKNV